METLSATDTRQLSEWYLQQKRSLPWRENRDPYRVWISEVMLQQTTTKAVIPFYEKFMTTFPKVEDLAAATEPEVMAHWAGLGYYSRARNLHRSAQLIAKTGFPKTARELLELPGFGPYTSRAVASLCFLESVGVLDGNVVRILTRRLNLSIPWWKTESQKLLQKLSDQLVSHGDPSVVNQAMMELGATVCTPQSPACLLCPWMTSCEARKNRTQLEIPLKKPKAETEIWVWRPTVHQRRGHLALVPNTQAPFLKKTLVFPGEFKKVKQAPKKFDFIHTITNHKIFVSVDRELKKKEPSWLWVDALKLAHYNPSSLLRKALAHSVEKN